MQALRDVVIFVTGGITFLPLCIAFAWLTHVVLSPPPADAASQWADGTDADDGADARETDPALLPPPLPPRDAQPTPDAEWHVTARQVLSDLAQQRPPQRGQPHVARAGWVLIRRHFQAPTMSELRISRPGPDDSDPDPERLASVGSPWHSDATLAVLRGFMLYLYAPVQQDELPSAGSATPQTSRGVLVDALVPVVALDLRFVLIGLQTVYGEAQDPAEHLREGVLYKRKNAVQLRTNPQALGVYTAPRKVTGAAAGSPAYFFASLLAASGASADGTGAAPGAPSKAIKAFLFCPSAPALEDWYTGMYLASQLPYDALSGLRLPVLPSELEAAAADRADPACAALNVLVARMFRSIAPTAAAEAGLIDKMMRKVALAKLPNILTDVQVQSVNLGSSPPRLSNLRLVPPEERRRGEASMVRGPSASSESEDADAACIEMSLVFEGNVHMSASAKLVLSSGFSFSSFSLGKHKKPEPLDEDKKDGKKGGYKVSLNMDIEFTRIVGTMRMLVKPPPSDRLWWAFVEPPELGLKITPIVSSRQVGWQYALDLIDSKIREAFTDSIVLPQMSDIAFANTQGLLQRGGLFADAARPGAANMEVVKRMGRTAAEHAAARTRGEKKPRSRHRSAPSSSPGLGDGPDLESATPTPTPTIASTGSGSDVGSSTMSTRSRGSTMTDMRARHKGKLAQAKAAWNEFGRRPPPPAKANMTAAVAAASAAGVLAGAGGLGRPSSAIERLHEGEKTASMPNLAGGEEDAPPLNGHPEAYDEGTEALWDSDHEHNGTPNSDALPARASAPPGAQLSDDLDARGLNSSRTSDVEGWDRSSLTPPKSVEEANATDGAAVGAEGTGVRASVPDTAESTEASEATMTFKERWERAKAAAATDRSHAEVAASQARNAIKQRWSKFQQKRAAQKAEQAWEQQVLAQAEQDRLNKFLDAGATHSNGHLDGSLAPAAAAAPSEPSLSPPRRRVPPPPSLRSEHAHDGPPPLPARPAPPPLPSRDSTHARDAHGAPPVPARPDLGAPSAPSSELPHARAPAQRADHDLAETISHVDPHLLPPRPAFHPPPSSAPSSALSAPHEHRETAQPSLHTADREPVAAQKSKAAPEPIAAPAPIAAPDPIAAPAPVVAPEPIAAPSPVAAPDPIAAPAPVAAPAPIAAADPVATPAPVTAPAPVAPPDPFAASRAVADAGIPSAHAAQDPVVAATPSVALEPALRLAQASPTVSTSDDGHLSEVKDVPSVPSKLVPPAELTASQLDGGDDHGSGADSFHRQTFATKPAPIDLA